MNCFFHVDREAVATCQDCGIGLCQECASKYNPCLCPECAKKRKIEYENERIQKKKDDLYNVKYEFLSSCLYGITIAGIIIAVGAYACISDRTIRYIPVIIILALLSYFASFGWKQTIGFKAGAFESNLFQVISFVIRVILSIIIGIPSFIFVVIKYVNGVERNRKM